MPAYKDKAKGTWYASFYFENWTGKKEKKMKRGFKTKREALEWERTFLQQQTADLDMTFESFVALYATDMKGRIKENTWGTKEHMARGDGIDRINARNMRLTETKIGNTQQHNEREKDSYVNQDIVLERTPLNVHFKTPSAGYREIFAQMEADGVISTRGIKEDAFRYSELVFDVNSAYFYNHGGYDFAKQFYTEAYKAAIKIVGGEQYILSAVMHADERNRAMSEALGEDVYHYHLHVVYIPVVEKEIRWTKRCKDKSLVGKVKETIMQVSMSKKWASKSILDEATGEPLCTAKGKPVLRKSYSVLQDDFFEHMRSAGYDNAVDAAYRFRGFARDNA